MRAKNLERNTDKQDQNGIALFRELKPSKKEAELIECENKLLRQTTQRELDSAFREAGTSSMCVEQLSKAPEPQYIKHFGECYAKLLNVMWQE